MSKFNRCFNGHVYDIENGWRCPYCGFDSIFPIIPPRLRSRHSLCSVGTDSRSMIFKLSGDMEYALKAVDCGTSSEMFEQVLNELEINNRLKGEPHAVQLVDYEIMERDGAKIVFLLEESNKTLTEYLGRNSIYASELIQLMTGVCDSWLACKKRDVLHLDVQPENIFIDDRNTVKLGNFSHSRFCSDAQSKQIVRGAPAYMAPEAYQEGEFSEQSDLYSIGLVLYFLFNHKKLPFMDSYTESEAVSKRINGTPLPDLSDGNEEIISKINGIVKRACSADPAERYAKISELKDALCILHERIKDNPELFDWPVYRKEIVLGKAFNSHPDDASYIHDDDFDSYTSHRRPHEGKAAPSGLFGRLKSSAKRRSRRRHLYSSVDDGYDMSYSMDFDDPYSDPDIGEEALWDDLPEPDKKHRINNVEFSAVAPKKLIKGDYSIINLVVYEKEWRHIVDSIVKEMEEPAQEIRSGVYNIKENSEIKIVLSSPDLEIEDDTDTREWHRRYLNFTFAVFLPEEYKKRQVLFIASVYVNGLIAAKLKFIVKCFTFFGQKIVITREDICSAFISYASQDRNRVAAIIQGMKKARPDMDVFFDVESLRSGDDWEKVLHQEIEKRDILFLCWSHFARESKWVDAEWRYALEKKGIDFIEPVPIEPPEVCPPPEELSRKHFNDKLLYIINSTRDRTE